MIYILFCSFIEIRVCLQLVILPLIRHVSEALATVKNWRENLLRVHFILF